VGISLKGSIIAVEKSAFASMSEVSMVFQPRIEEPSKGMPSGMQRS
jgi:hypothetical protein